MEELLKSREFASSDEEESVWKRLADIPVPYNTSLATLDGRVLAIGGSENFARDRSGAIHSYNESSNSWSVIGEMPTPRSDPLVAVLPRDKLMVVGGYDNTGEACKTNEITHTN